MIHNLETPLGADQAVRGSLEIHLASQCLGFGLRELHAQWLDQHGYRPLMAESFQRSGKPDRPRRPRNYPFFTLSVDGDHGRLDIRSVAVEPLKALDVLLLGARSAVKVKRHRFRRINIA
jgi:hypothetical protein